MWTQNPQGRKVDQLDFYQNIKGSEYFHTRPTKGCVRVTQIGDEGKVINVGR